MSFYNFNSLQNFTIGILFVVNYNLFYAVCNKVIFYEHVLSKSMYKLYAYMQTIFLVISKISRFIYRYKADNN